MAALSVQQSNGAVAFADPSGQEAWEISQYEKIMEIRDQVFAGTHPRLKLLNPVAQDAPAVLSQAPSIPHETGSISYSTLPNQKPPANAGISYSLHPYSSTQSQVPSNSSPAVIGASGIDPIFLTKSDVLLRAETQQKRQRIERVLADQVKEKQAASKHKSFDHDDLPEFNVTEVLRKAQELVKPVKFTESSGANGNASASDSFDENTFYSSQMNDSTPEPTDKPEPSRKAPPPPNCHFFIRGEHCPYGEHCKYPHGSAMPPSEQGWKVQVGADDNDNADTQAPSGASNAEQQPPTRNRNSNSNNNNTAAPQPLSQAERIVRLEAELMALRGEQSDTSAQSLAVNTSNAGEAQEEESVYSPPDAVPPNPNEGSTRSAVRRKNAWQRRDGAPAAEGSKYQRRGKGKRDKAVQEEARSPVINEGRVVRNHITSPLAPQPARVSPLAVAKAPPIPQPQDDQGPGQVSNPKKRRREHEPEPVVRNVAARREPPSPEIRVKEEPMSPPPPRFAETADRWEPRRRGNDRGPIYVDDVSPRFQDAENPIYRPNVIDRPAPRYVLDDYREAAPPMHEPDLRRVVSTRQARAPLAGNERYASPQAPPARAVSQIYLPRQEQDMPRQYRGSIQPEQAQYIDRDMAPSPRFREVSTMMAPPPRRIVVDQHGNQFYEQEVAPMPRPRQLSMAPFIRQGAPDQGYPMPGPRQSVMRIPQASESAEESRYIRRGPSPASPQYIEYSSPTHIRQPVPRDGEMYYSNAPQPRHGDGMRVVEYGPPQANGRYEELRPMEGVSRVASVRPVGARYEGGPERVTRVQSVLPEGRRVVSLGGETIPQGTRHMSIRPDDPYVRPVEYAPARTQYYPGPDGRG
ncbi:MAG: hypothetical protein L6R38_007680 [Xanthoria sp. 2 TBL-2021]|nr:MAG: hypothetical protein L6R38_007680 [Xanthoria sp. 2 TBL-2021]